MADYISRNFVPVKIHIKEQPATFERFRAQWTPTLIITDSEGVEHYRFEGYLPVKDFITQLELGRAHTLFAEKRWTDAEAAFRSLLRENPQSELAPEALYWAGVSHYKATGDASALRETATAFQRQYPGTSWAKKASVWAA